MLQSQWRIQDFPPRWGCQPPGGGANIRFCQNFPKLYEIERIWTGGASKILLCRSATACLTFWSAMCPQIISKRQNIKNKMCKKFETAKMYCRSDILFHSKMVYNSSQIKIKRYKKVINKTISSFVSKIISHIYWHVLLSIRKGCVLKSHWRQTKQNAKVLHPIYFQSINETNTMGRQNKNQTFYVS